MPKVLVIEDERDLALVVSRHLAKEGYDVVQCARGDTAVATVLREAPDLVLLDVMLPGLSGIEVCRELRARGVEVPIIMLTAKSDEIDRVIGLEIGADDYVVKPFGIAEVLARVRARLRRGTVPAGRSVAHYRFGGVEVDFDRHQVRREGRPVELSPKELDVLRLLVRYRGEVVTREHMLRQVWGYDATPTTRTIDTHILRLRHKLEDDPAEPHWILSIYGEGYKFIG